MLAKTTRGILRIHELIQDRDGQLRDMHAVRPEIAYMPLSKEALHICKQNKTSLVY